MISHMSTVFPSQLAIGYCRVSTSEQAQHGWSIEQQEGAIRAWALTHHLDLVAVFRDAGKSGCTLTGRAGLRGLIEVVAQRGIGVVVAKAQDRLSRTVDHFHALKKFIHRHGTDLCTLDGGLHLPAATSANGLESSSSNLMSGLASILAEQEIDTLRSRILPNLEMAIRAGRRGGRVPLGYRREADGSISVDPHDSAIFYRCVSESISGTGVSQLVHRLAAEGVRDHEGQVVSFDRLRGALTNRYGLGELHWQVPVESRSSERSICIHGHHPALIDPVTFATLQTSLNGRARRTPSSVLPTERRRARRRSARLPVNQDLVMALTPLSRPVHGAVSPDAARCDHCDGVMYAVLQTVGGRGERRRVPIYQCRRHKDLGAAICPQPPIAAEVVDEAVFTAVERALRHHQRQELPLSTGLHQAPISEHTVALEKAEAACARMRPIAEKLGTTAPHALRDQLAASEANVIELKALVRRAAMTPTQPNGMLWDFRRHPRQTWNLLDAAGRRAVLAPLLRCVRIRDKKVVGVELIPVDTPTVNSP